MRDEEIYSTLGVPPDADAATVSTAYRKLALANHPDRAPHDRAAAQRFTDASAAYAAWLAKHGPPIAPAPLDSRALGHVEAAFHAHFGHRRPISAFGAIMVVAALGAVAVRLLMWLLPSAF